MVQQNEGCYKKQSRLARSPSSVTLRVTPSPARGEGAARPFNLADAKRGPLRQDVNPDAPF